LSRAAEEISPVNTANKEKFMFMHKRVLKIVVCCTQHCERWEKAKNSNRNSQQEQRRGRT